ncbi:MAG: TonB-dependent receptor [Gammaproteobacteria bacterium]
MPVATAVFAADPPQPPPEKATALPRVKVETTEEDGFTTDSTGTATRTDTPMRDIPQYINTVPQQLIRSQGATSLQDALRNVPGISYAAPEGGTQANQVFFLRGFPLSADLFIDGVRDLGEYNRDLFDTESVEVLKGSSSLLFGRGSTGGLVNQDSKVADRDVHREVALQAGSFDQKRVTADFSTVADNNNSALRVVGLLEDSGSYRYPEPVKKTGLAPSFWTQIGDATNATLSYYYLKEDSVTDYAQPALFINQGKGTFLGFSKVSPRTYYGFANNDFSHYDTSIATFKVDHAFSDSLKLKNTLRWANYQRQTEATITEGIVPTATDGTPVTAATPLSLIQVIRNHDTNRSRDNDDDALINQTDLTWKVSTGAIKHSLLAGLELSRERLHRQNYLLDANPTTAGVQAPSVTSPILAPQLVGPQVYTKTPNLLALAEGKSVAFLVQDQIEFSEQWKALVGVRHERYEADASAVSIAPPGTVGAGVAAGPFSRTDNMVSGRVGLIWQPTEKLSWYVSWSDSFNPSGELGTGDSPTGFGGRTAQTNLSASSQNVDPEKNQNYELGGQWDVGAIQLRSAIFRNEKTNAREVDPTNTTTVTDGKRRVDGIELEASGSITRDWDLYSGFAYMDGKIIDASPFGTIANTNGTPTGPITDVHAFCALATTRCLNVNGNTPFGVAKIAGNIWTVYRLGGGFEVGGGVRGQKGTWLTDRNDPGSQIPTYVLVDATVAYVQPQYELRLNGNNLTDKLYYYGGYNNRPDRVLPGAPRSISVTLRYYFK